jgi:hypothetical protein
MPLEEPSLRSPSVADDVITLLDREHEHLQGLDGTTFLLRLPSYVSFVTGQRAFRSALLEMQQEAQRALQDFVEQENDIISKAVAIREDFAEKARGAEGVDDAGMKEPERASDDVEDRYAFSLAKFDKLAAQDLGITFPTTPDDDAEQGPVSEMLNILRGKVRVAQFGEGPYLEGTRENRRPDLNVFGDQLRDLLEQHEHAVRAFRQASRTLPGFALGRLEHFASNLNPEPDVKRPGESLAERFDRVLRMQWSPLWLVQKSGWRAAARRARPSEAREHHSDAEGARTSLPHRGRAAGKRGGDQTGSSGVAAVRPIDRRHRWKCDRPNSRGTCDRRRDRLRGRLPRRPREQ